MPIVDMPVKRLLDLVNRGEGDVTAERLGQLLPRIGCFVEEVAETEQYACSTCGKVVDRTEAQGPPLSCANCGTDFREQPDTLRGMGSNEVFRLELLSVRPDIFDVGGMSRLVRGHVGLRTGLIDYPIEPARITVAVDPRLRETTSYRPYIACAVLRDVELNHDAIKVLMNLQEDLHWALGRNRKLASIGVYDLDTLSGETFRYDAVAPDELRFVPLGFSPGDTDSAITPGEVLERHKTGREFARLLEGFERYPLLRDGAGNVLSMPPIINSENTRVGTKSRELFVDVTGQSRRTVNRALNIIVANLSEALSGIRIEAVTIRDDEGEHDTPSLAPQQLLLELATVNNTIGVGMNITQLKELLERMGHRVTFEDNERLLVDVPAWRNDVMHAVDLIEDAAIAYGYDYIAPVLVPTFTVGAPRAVEEHSTIARRAMTGLGFHQVMTLTLTNETAAFERWRIEPDPRAVRIDNPISTEQTICRVSLRPGLLETLSINKQYELPQQIFEVGDCCFVDERTETGAHEQRFVAAAMIGSHVGYADIRAVLDAFLHEFGHPLEYRAVDHPSFIPGRAAGLYDARGRELGAVGEVHPEILEGYGLKHAVSLFELNLQQLVEE